MRILPLDHDLLHTVASLILLTKTYMRDIRLQIRHDFTCHVCSDLYLLRTYTSDITEHRRHKAKTRLASLLRLRPLPHSTPVKRRRRAKTRRASLPSHRRPHHHPYHEISRHSEQTDIDQCHHSQSDSHSAQGYQIHLSSRALIQYHLMTGK